MKGRDTIQWLLDGDVSIQFQCQRNLLNKKLSSLQKRIDIEGWGAVLLSNRNEDGSWNHGFYQPKWISSHYSLFDLRKLCVWPDHKIILSSIEKLALKNKSNDGE